MKPAEIKLTFDLNHWLFGINWDNNTSGYPDGLWIIAVHFGPWCLMRTTFEL